MSRQFLIALALLLAAPAALADDSIFRKVAPGLKLEFPRDHGAHPAYSTEWWYDTGHLASEPGRAYGFELVFFRIGVNPEQRSRSAWAAGSVYLSHFALTDDGAKRFYQAERRSRGSFAEAGAAEDRLKAWNKDWKVELHDGTMTLHGSAADVALDLSLQPTKLLVLHGTFECGLASRVILLIFIDSPAMKPVDEWVVHARLNAKRGGHTLIEHHP